MKLDDTVFEKQLSKQLAIQLGRRLKHARETRGLKQEDVAMQLGKHFQTISRIECGRVEPSLAQIHRFAQLYGVSVACLVDPHHAVGLDARGLQAVEGAA